MKRNRDDLFVTNSFVYAKIDPEVFHDCNSGNTEEDKSEINNNRLDYYANNALSGTGSPLVSNQVTQHMKTEEEREM